MLCICHTHMSLLFPFPLACITALLLCLASSQVLLSAISSVLPEAQGAGGLSQPSLSSAVSSWIPPCSARTVRSQRCCTLPSFTTCQVLIADSSILICPETFVPEGDQAGGLQPGALTAPGPLAVENDLQLPVVSFSTLKHSVHQGSLAVVFIREKSLSLRSTKRLVHSTG